jgi:hypothetical protein
VPFSLDLTLGRLGVDARIVVAVEDRIDSVAAISPPKEAARAHILLTNAR